MKRTRLLLLCAAMFFLTICGHALQTNPVWLSTWYVRMNTSLLSDDEKIKAVLRAFLTALEQKDFEAARKLATASSESILSMVEMAMKMQENNPQKDSKPTFDSKHLKIRKVNVKEEKARVQVCQDDTSEITWFTLKQEAGEWKVAFDKSFMSENAKPAAPELKKAMNELNKGRKM